MTIISASYKTDIPGLCGDWFRARRLAESFEVRNAWNGKAFPVSLRNEDCSRFIFWTLNVKPFYPELERTARTHPFVVQYTITVYPRSLERSVVAVDAGIADIREISGLYGGKSVVWRYNPAVIMGATPATWHIENFTRIASTLVGSVDEVVVSFAQIYRKTRRNLDRAAQETGNAWTDPKDGAKRDLPARLNEIARQSGLALSLCAQPALEGGLTAARCIDATRLDNVAHFMGHAAVTERTPARTKAARPGCLCAQSRDIGGYETYPHRCVYCYAVGNLDKAKQAHKAHERNAVMLGTETTSPGPEKLPA